MINLVSKGLGFFGLRYIYIKTNFMKHILNNMSEEEKNSIREQHTGGMKVMTENFNKLLNSKLGDSKPLVEQGVPKTATPTKPATPSPKQTSLPLTNKTVNLYYDAKNVNFYKTATIKTVNTGSDGLVYLFLTNGAKITFNCLYKTSLDYEEPTEQGTEINERVYNTPLIAHLSKTYCTASSGGASVPKADFASNSSNTNADFA